MLKNGCPHGVSFVFSVHISLNLFLITGMALENKFHFITALCQVPCISVLCMPDLIYPGQQVYQRVTVFYPYFINKDAEA